MDRIDDLVAAHPALFRTNAPQAFSDLPAGWYDLADRLCCDIEAALGAQAKRFKVKQIKEKFGVLRLYFSFGSDEDRYVDVQSPQGAETFSTKSSGPPELEKLRDLVRGASERSAMVCQECGESGRPHSHKGWVQALCTRHAKERAARTSTLKIQLASDLHLERLDKRFKGPSRIVEPQLGADVLVLAGDIHSGTRAIEVFGDWPVPVLYVAGNHEFYGASFEQTRADLRRASTGSQVRFLDNESLELGGVRFLGCTLWTDFRLPGRAQQEWMRRVGKGLNDYVVIRTQAGMLRPQQTLEDHEQSRRWLERELARPFSGKSVVVTHHAPHPLSIYPRHVGNGVNAGFVSDLTPLVLEADLWLHGHVHDSFDYEVGGCRVVANPAGYVLNARVATPGTCFEFENRHFDPALTVELS